MKLYAVVIGYFSAPALVLIENHSAHEMRHLREGMRWLMIKSLRRRGYLGKDYLPDEVKPSSRPVPASIRSPIGGGSEIDVRVSLEEWDILKEIATDTGYPEGRVFIDLVKEEAFKCIESMPHDGEGKKYELASLYALDNNLTMAGVLAEQFPQGQRPLVGMIRKETKHGNTSS